MQAQKQPTEWSRGCVSYVQSTHSQEYSKYKRKYTSHNQDSQHTHREHKHEHEQSILCIPRVPASVTHEHIQQVFSKLNAGTLTKITDIQLRNETEHKRIILRIVWNQTPMAQYIKNRLFAGNNVKLVYSDPWYWKLVLGRPRTDQISV